VGLVPGSLLPAMQLQVAFDLTGDILRDDSCLWFVKRSCTTIDVILDFQHLAHLV